MVYAGTVSSCPLLSMNRVCERQPDQALGCLREGSNGMQNGLYCFKHVSAFWCPSKSTTCSSRLAPSELTVLMLSSLTLHQACSTERAAKQLQAQSPKHPKRQGNARTRGSQPNHPTHHTLPGHHHAKIVLIQPLTNLVLAEPPLEPALPLVWSG